jgi:hypothetical protein
MFQSHTEDVEEEDDDEPENIVDNPDYHPGISINRQLLILRLIICTEYNRRGDLS